MTKASKAEEIKDPKEMSKAECLKEMDKIELEFSLISLIPLEHRYWHLRNRITLLDSQDSSVK